MNDVFFIMLKNNYHNSRPQISGLRTDKFACFFCHAVLFNIKTLADDTYALDVVAREHTCSFEGICRTTTNIEQNPKMQKPSEATRNMQGDSSIKPSQLTVSGGAKRSLPDESHFSSVLDRIERDTGNVDIAKAYIILSYNRNLLNSAFTRTSVELSQEIQKLETRGLRKRKGAAERRLNVAIEITAEMLMATLKLNDKSFFKQVNTFLKGEETTYADVYKRFVVWVEGNLKTDSKSQEKK